LVAALEISIFEAFENTTISFVITPTQPRT